MPSGKDRLVLCLYHRSGAAKMPGGEDEFHWALALLPKMWHAEGSGTLHHAKDNPPIPGVDRWKYEKRPLSSVATPNLLARIIIAKVTDAARLEEVLNNVPIPQEDPSWNCVYWVKEALERLNTDTKALGTRQSDWNIVRDRSLQYVKQKIANGRYEVEFNHDRSKPPTYDILAGSEILP